MLRSSRFLQEQVSLRREAERRRLDALGGEIGPDTDPFDRRVHQRGLVRIEQMEGELASGSGSLDVAFDGKGVHGRGRVEFQRLAKLVKPVGQALRHTAGDLLVIDGDPKPADRTLLVEPVFAGAFDSSFGIHIARPPAEEQLSAFRGPLFDRTAERFISVFRAGRDAQGDASPIIDAVQGLRTRSLQGYRALAKAMADTGQVTRIAWQGDEVVAITPRAAEFVSEVLGLTRAEEEIRPVRGVLTGGDIDDERFHIIPDADEEGWPQNVRGAVEPALLPKLRLLTFGTRVRAEVAVISTVSDLVERPRDTYVLRAITRLPEGKR